MPFLTGPWWRSIACSWRKEIANSTLIATRAFARPGVVRKKPPSQLQQNCPASLGVSFTWLCDSNVHFTMSGAFRHERG
jgi:hypothetical protein